MTAPARTIIRGGIRYSEDGAKQADILIEGERISAIEPHIPDTVNATVIDATGLTVLPGMIDFHVHLDDRIGSCELADSYLSGSQAAILTGVTTLISFVTQTAGNTLRQSLEAASAKVRKGSYCDVHFHLTPTTFSDSDWDGIERLVKQGCRTFKFYTTYKEAGLYQSYESLRLILKRLSQLQARVLIHCEEQNVLDQARSDTSLDYADAYTHARLRPPAAEINAIRQVIELAEQTGVELHVVHVSTDEGVDLLHRAKTSLPITFETAPHYLYFSDQKLKEKDGHRFICSPPLRAPEIQAKLCEQAAGDFFDVFATDHCAFNRSDKDSHPEDIRKVPNGLAGIGALVPLTYEFYSTRGKKPSVQMAATLAANPARISCLYPRKGVLRVGSDADIVVLAENAKPRPIRASLNDCYDPYAGMTTGLDFRYVFRRGSLVVRDNQLTDAVPNGHVVYSL